MAKFRKVNPEELVPPTEDEIMDVIKEQRAIDALPKSNHFCIDTGDGGFLINIEGKVIICQTPTEVARRIVHLLS